MCGIVGYIGKKEVLPILIKGLKRLEYRGYDSAGVAYVLDDQIKVKKCVGRISQLEQIVSYKEKSSIGIGHTRWATHGGVDTKNSHPHQVQNITIVHNGILENYQELKEELLKLGYSFQSATDTEVACAYIDFLYQQSKDKNMVDVLEQCMKVFQGSYAIALMVQGNADTLYVMKKDSPLVIGIGKDGYYIASDISAYGDDTSGYIILEDMEIGVILPDKLTVYQNGLEIQPVIKHATFDFNDSQKCGYEHYMLKEIHEQSGLISKLNQKYLKNILELFDLSLYQKIHIIGCGTAYHAGLIGKYFIEKYSDFEVSAFIASEYRYQKLFVDANTLVIAVSQSGETADTLACLKRVKDLGCKTLGVVNVRDSSIARIVDEVIYTEAGTEIAVASTKAYLSQIYIFSLLAFRLGLSKQLLDFDNMLLEYKKLPTLIDEMVQGDYEKLVESFYQKDDIFYLGRNIDYVSMLEGSLKLKEISYIHSEAMQAGELKHGTISLIEKDTCVISLISLDELASKTISNIKEVKARGAYVILLIRQDLASNLDKDCYDELIMIKKTTSILQPLLNIIPLQLIAYYVAKRRGCDIDKPRNLAKSVTVE